jgi:glutathionylspermidine amidase/synthetase
MPVLFRILFSFIILATISACSVREMPASCQTDCVEPYGVVLGSTSQGVKAYSNCQSKCVNYEPHDVKDVYTGIKWQCVEYARRWLFVNKGAVYGDVETAADIWDKIDHLTHVATNKKIPLESHLNGSTNSPRVGDLLIYARAFYDTGHVAVVFNIDHENGFIEVGEQNYNNQQWPDNYSRKIKFINDDGRFWLLDSYLLGWKQIVGKET